MRIIILKKELMNSTTAIKIMLSLIVIELLFHLSIMTSIIPYDYVWSGRLKSASGMYFSELISIAVNLFLGFILLMKGRYTRPRFTRKSIDRWLWAFIVFFILNTFVNIFSTTRLEQFFAVVTLLFVWMIFKVLNSNRGPAQQNIINQKK